MASPKSLPVFLLADVVALAPVLAYFSLAVYALYLYVLRVLPQETTCAALSSAALAARPRSLAAP